MAEEGAASAGPLVLAPLVYTDLAGTGGHGGEGRHAESLAHLHGLGLRLQALETDADLVSAHCHGNTRAPGPNSLKEIYLYETEVLGAVNREPIDRVPGAGTGTPPDQPGPRPVPQLPVQPHPAVGLSLPEVRPPQALGESRSDRRRIVFTHITKFTQM